jgi:DNA-directed RNA polymerase specialized sigma24 family protein
LPPPEQAGRQRLAGLAGGWHRPAPEPELFQAHQLELVRLAVLMVGDLATAEDVVQDAFEQLHRRWRTLRKPSNALDYARSAVLNGCRPVHRRRLVARRHEPRIAASAWQDTDAAAAIEQRTEFIDAFRALWP